MALTIADGVVLLIIAVSALLAYSRGLTREVLAIGGWILAAMVAFFFAPILEPLMREIPVVGGFLATSCTLSVLAAFATAFAVMLVVLSIFTPLVSGLIRDSAVGPVDRGLGFLFGVARGVALVAVLWLLYDLTVPDAQRLPSIDEAMSVAFVTDAAEAMRAAAPTETPTWLGSRIDALMGACGSTATPGATL